MKEKELIGWGWAPTGYLPGLWVRYKITSDIFENFWTHNKDKLPCEAQDVRGLLCRHCNDFLGKIEDNYETLNNLANYLKNHGRRHE